MIWPVLLEPTGCVIEGGCQGTLRAEVTARGVRAHSARSWRGRNAIHGAERHPRRAAVLPIRASPRWTGSSTTRG